MKELIEDLVEMIIIETKDQDQVLQLEIEMTEDPKKNLQVTEGNL